MSKENFSIKLIEKSECKDLLKKYHYLSNISRGFKSGKNYGLFHNDILCGVCIFTGFPVPELVVGCFGLDKSDQDGLYELSRLCLEPEIQKEEHNLASWFVARCIRDLRKNNNVRAILSYADTHFHKGTIYRALNFKYYGLTTPKKDFWIKQEDGTFKKLSRGKSKGVEGEWRDRSRKHRFLITYDKKLKCKWEEKKYTNIELKKFIQNTNNMYEVYTDGKIYSYYSNKFLKLDKSKGYYRVTLTMEDKSLLHFYCHRLVANAFIPNPENKPTVNHIDGNKLNNNVKNLEWATVSENCKHANDTGLRIANKGEDCSYAKLTNKIVKEIKQDISDGMIYDDISDKHNISPATISLIKNGKRWGDEKTEITSRTGSKNVNSKLNEEKVKDIFELLKQKKPQTEIAKLYGVDKGLISSIARRKSWTHVETDYVYEKVTNKIDDSIYTEVIDCYNVGGITRKQVAEKFSISKSMVDKILKTR